MKKIIFTLLALFILTACQTTTPSARINSFESCIAAGNPAMESYPRQCRTKEGQTFTEKLSRKEECRVAGGNWLTEYNECEYVGKDWCEGKGGAWKECESACRHDPEAEICTLQCVLVCEF